MSYRTAELRNLDNEFAYAAQAILDGSEPTIENLENLLDKYNAIIAYVEIDWDRKKYKTKEHVGSVIEANRITIQRCFEVLNLPLTLPGQLLSTIHYIPSKKQPKKQAKPGVNTHSQTDQIDTKLGSTQTKSPKIGRNSTQTDVVPLENNSTQTKNTRADQNSTQTDVIPVVNNSTQTTPKMDQFLKLCGSQINKPFDGDPLLLQAFIDTVNLLKTVVPADGTETLRLFVLSKLTKKARECLRTNPKTIEEIIEDLNKYIKPDNSKIVEGRLIALKCNQGKLHEFSEQAEELAEALQRTLIIEGVSQEKAKQMTIERTIDLCRQTARSELVKGIIASTTFTSPKDVLAKFIVENTKEKSEKQILSMRQQGTPRTFYSQNFPNNSSNQFQNRNSYNQRRGYQRNFNNGYNNRGNTNANQYRNFRGNNRNFQQSNGRGRGGFRNNFNNNNNNERYVRMVAENCHGPPNGRAENETVQPNAPTIMRLSQN